MSNNNHADSEGDAVPLPRNHSLSEPTSTPPENANTNNHNLFIEIFTAYLFWAAFGFIFFTHWLVLVFLSYRYCQHDANNDHDMNVRYRKKFNQNRFGSFLQHACSIIALVIFALGGLWCRSSGNSTPCPNGETMSHECLFSVQTKKYQAIYTLHYIGLAYMAIQWILDGIQLWGWVLQLRSQEEQVSGEVSINCMEPGLLHALWAPRHVLLSPAYPFTILFINLWVTLTWAVFYTDWSTSGGKLYSLGWRVIVAGLGALAVALVILHRGCLRWYRGNSHDTATNSHEEK